MSFTRARSRQFVAAAKKLDKPVTYVEFEGQGHGVTGLRNNVTYFQTRFDFLTEVVCQRNENRLSVCEE